MCNLTAQKKEASLPAKLPYRVALSIGFIPPYQIRLFEALDVALEEFRIFTSTPMEPNRPWIPAWGRLNVTVQRSINLQRTHQHPYGFSFSWYSHWPYDTLFLLQRFRPDVIISTELGIRTLQVAVWCKINRNTQLIVWPPVSEHTEKGRGRIRSFQSRWILGTADSVLVYGESGARYVRRLGVPKEKIFRAPHPTEELFLSVPLFREPSIAHRLLYVGQLIERKGLLPFLSTLSQWARDHTERNLEFWLVGDGPLRANLEHITLPPNISMRLLGNVPYEQLPGIYTQAGILVFPTLLDDWGVVVNEAMAAGLPVLGSLYSQAVEELVTEGGTGWTFYPDQEAAMYTGLDRALSSTTGVLDQMRVASRKRAQELSPDIVAGRVLQAIGYVRQLKAT